MLYNSMLYLSMLGFTGTGLQDWSTMFWQESLMNLLPDVRGIKVKSVFNQVALKGNDAHLQSFHYLT